MTAIIDLPATIAGRQSHQNFWIAGGAAALRGLNGREQVLYTENRRWEGRIDLATLSGANILEGRSIGTKLRGRANLLRVPVCNAGTLRQTGTLAKFYADAGVSEAHVALGYIPFSDGTIFTDGTGFALPDPADPTVFGAADAGSSSIRLTGYIGRNITVGARFSINDFLYEVEANDDGQLTISPPLREDVADGVTAEVTSPTILVRLARPDGWQPFVNAGRFTSAMQVELVEAFER